MQYEIWLLDGISEIKLDTDGIDIQTTFSVADIKDISLRKDNITKDVVFKGTKNNNKAFGSLFHANKVTDTSLPNEIGPNANGMRPIDCLVYENGTLLFKGSLRVLSVKSPDNIEIYYYTCITGKFIDFKSTIQDRFLTDIDFSDLKHQFTLQNIVDSWSVRTQRTQTGVSGFVYQPFQKGSGYVYPFIDYGIQFRTDAEGAETFNQNPAKHNISNFKAAIYANEYMKRIFEQAGCTMEVKGDAAFKERWNSLTIPNADERQTFKLSGFTTSFWKPTILVENQSGAIGIDKYHAGKLLNIQNWTPPPASTIDPYIKHDTNQNIMVVDRNFKSDAAIFTSLDGLRNEDGFPLEVWVQLVERNYINNDSAKDGWEVVAESKKETIVPFSTPVSKSFSITVGEREFREKKQLAIRVVTKYNMPVIFGWVPLQYTTGLTSASFPKDEFTAFTADVKMDGTIPDAVTPKAPDGIKQIDFIKGLVNTYHLYIYNTTENEKHFIIQKYDDYYAYTNIHVIKDNALNWSHKVDYAKGWDRTENYNIPKNYLFTYKDDNDVLNADYKRLFGEAYGTLKLPDAFGVTEEKKVQLIFSPTPLYQLNGTRRIHPALWSGTPNEWLQRKPAKTNIRLLYYNGLMDCQEYAIAKERYVSNKWVVEDAKVMNQYPNCSTFFYENGQPVEDLNFHRSKSYYFNPTDAYLNVDYAYQSYYINQITELTNANIYTVQCYVLLNEIDINNLNLRIPVFIDNAAFGSGYYKVLSVEYQNNYTPSKVMLQKIYLGTLR